MIVDGFLFGLGFAVGCAVAAVLVPLTGAGSVALFGVLGWLERRMRRRRL